MQRADVSTSRTEFNLGFVYVSAVKFARWMQEVTTRARHYVCDDDRSRSSSSSSAASAADPTKRSCEMETGYYLNPRDSCQTYSVFGRLPPLDAFQRSVVCVRPGVLSDMFDVSHQLADTASIFVDKTIKCVRLSYSLTHQSRLASNRLKSIFAPHPERDFS